MSERKIYHGFEAVIGLEVHGQLSTQAKLFCRCSTDFKAEVNQAICPVCSGQPGALPMLNRQAIDRAILAGLALNCKINEKSVFSRKNYFYPDLPKGYQISQFDLPLCSSGFIDIEFGGTPQNPETHEKKRVRIQRIHVEEDAGKSIHMTGYSLVNLNRSSTPLIEIVSEPDMTCPEEAGAYLRKLRTILMYIGVNDGNMQEGSLRCDANVSVRLKGEQKLGTRAEIKNLNSFRFLEKAVEYEIHRQIEVVKAGGKVVQETRGYDSAKNTTYSMRSKEEAHDYRYFPEPDLLPLLVNEAWIQQVKGRIVELPDAKRERYIKEWSLPAYDSFVITDSQSLAQFFEETVAICGEPKTVSNWVMGELLRLMKTKSTVDENGDEKEEKIPVTSQNLGALVKLIKSGAISNSVGKTVFEEMFQTGKAPDVIVKEKGLGQVSDTKAIEEIIDKVLAANPGPVAEYRGGKDKLFGFFVGQTMKAMQGKGNPGMINDLLKKKLT